jgi:DNA-binding XRE family transcriptional regulator
MYSTSLREHYTNKLRGAMRKNQMTQTSLAEKSGISTRTISLILAGKVDSYLGTWEVLLTAAGAKVP